MDPKHWNIPNFLDDSEKKTLKGVQSSPNLENTGITGGGGCIFAKIISFLRVYLLNWGK